MQIGKIYDDRNVRIGTLKVNSDSRYVTDIWINYSDVSQNENLC